MRITIAFLCLILFSSSIFAKDKNDCSSIKGMIETVSFSGLNDSFNIEHFFVTKNVAINNKEVECEFRTGIPINWSVYKNTCYSFQVYATGNETKRKHLKLDSLNKCSKF